MTQTAADLESTFRRSWTLLLQNLILIVPGLIAGAIVVVCALFFTLFGVGLALVASSTHSIAAWAIFGLAIAAGLIVVLFVGAAATAATTAMAAEAWETGATTLGTGWTAVTSRSLAMFYATLLLALVGCVALLFALPTLLISLLAYLTFFLYVAASVVVGGRDATQSLAESCHLAARNFWPTLGVAVLIVVVSVIAAGVGSIFSHAAPFVGAFVSIAIQQAAVAYAALVVVGEYSKLRQP